MTFKAQYNEAKRRMLDGTINKLPLASSGAVDVLEAIAHDLVPDNQRNHSGAVDVGLAECIRKAREWSL